MTGDDYCSKVIIYDTENGIKRFGNYPFKKSFPLLILSNSVINKAIPPPPTSETKQNLDFLNISCVSCVCMDKCDLGFIKYGFGFVQIYNFIKMNS